MRAPRARMEPAANWPKRSLGLYVRFSNRPFRVKRFQTIHHYRVDVALYEAAQSMPRSKKWSWLKAWAMQIARRRGMKKAIVALARRLAVIMHRILVDGTEFRWTREQATAAA